MKPPYKTLVQLGCLTLLALPAAMMAASDYQTTVLSQSPAAYYRLNETIQPPATLPNVINTGSVGAPGNGTYETVSTIRGVTPGALVSQPGNGSVTLTGGVDGNRVRIPYDPAWNTVGPFSFEFWHKPGPASISQCAAANVEFIASTPVPQRNGWLLYQNSGASLLNPGWSLRFYNSTALNGVTILDVAAPVNTNAWYHIVGTFNGTTISLYTNGALAGSAPITGTFRQNTNSAIPLTFGARADGVSGYFSSRASFDEAAYYTTVLSPAQVLAHYQAGTNAAPGTPYQSVILADAPVGYWRLDEPGDVVTANLGTLGSAGNGVFLPGSVAAATGPVPPVYPGFGATNKAAAFTANGSAVRLPGFNFNTNTITISGWISATNSEQPGAGLVVNGGGSGLIIDGAFGGYGLGYYWNNTEATYLWSPSIDAGLPTLPDSDWAFAAVVIQPTEANIYIGITNGGNITFTGVTNYFAHSSQTFSTATLVGSDAGDPTFSFNGAIDEVALWNRSLSSGELYTQFAAALDGVPATILTDLVGPTEPSAVGEALNLSVNAGGTSPLVYTWYKDNVAIAANTNIGTFTIASLGFGDAGSYRVTVTNNFGSTNSQSVAVTVVTPSTPAITEIVGYKNRTLYLGATLRFQVLATGGGLKYQWYKNATPITDATSSIYSVGVTNISQAGSFSVRVTNLVGVATSGPPAVISIPNMASNSYEGLIITSAPEAWWRLDEAPGSTNLFDGMGRHDGIYTNLLGTSPPVALGVPGALVGDTNTGASFSGNQGIGLISNAPALSPQQFTIEAWVRTTVTDDPNLCPISSIYGTAGEYWRTSPVGEWRPYSSNAQAPLKDNGQTNAVVVQNQWTHLIMAYDSSLTGFPWIYAINGFRATTSWSGAAPNTEGPIIIGARGVDATTLAQFFWKGQVDEVAIYPRVLSNAEMAAHYAARGVEILPPTFGEPLLSQTVTAGKIINFSTTVFGTSPVLRWYKGTPQASAPIATGTNALYLNPTAFSDAGTYSLVASNSVGSVTNTASLTVISPVAYANVTNDLVLHLRFEGNAQDSSGKGNNGTPSGSPAPNFVTGKVGAQAAEFTTTTINVTNFSTASYVDLGTPSDLLFGSGTSFTVGMWVKLPVNAVPGDVPFIGTEVNAANNPGWFFGPSYRAGGWQWNLNDGVNNIGREGADNSINDGNWHYFIVTVDRAGAVVKGYLDGVLVANTSITGIGSVDVGGAVTIAQDPTHTYPEASTYTLDDLGIWRRALTPAEVANIESAGSAGNSFDTVAPAAVSLTITYSGGNVLVGYPSGTLQQSDSLTNPVWTPVPGASAPSYATSPTNLSKFYRVLVQ